MIWKLIRGLMALLGGVLIYVGVSTSDYYVLELGTTEPSYVWWMICVGLMLILPAIIFSVYSEAKENNDVHR